MISAHAHGAAYGLRPDLARPIPPGYTDNADSQREPLQMAVDILAWIVVPAVFWAGLAAWLLV